MSIGFYKNFNFNRFIKNKSAEIQLHLFAKNLACDYFEFKFKWTQNQDHAGISLTISVLYLFYFHIMTYDHRHWDYDRKCWEEE